MNSTRLQQWPANALLAAATDAAKSGNESSIAIAFALLKRRHRNRPDVRRKLLELVDRKLGAPK